MPEYLTVDEVAKIARAPLATVRYWLWSGRLKSFKPGRRVLVRRDHLVEFIEGSAANG